MEIAFESTPLLSSITGEQTASNGLPFISQRIDLIPAWPVTRPSVGRYVYERFVVKPQPLYTYFQRRRLHVM